MNNFIKRILSSIILIPLVVFFAIKGSYIFNSFLLLCLIISIYEWYSISKNKIYNIPGILFLFFSFYTVYFVRNNFNGEFTFFFLVLIICISTDIGGYLFGKIFKGPRISKISPNKTYSGVIGSFFLAIIFTLYFIDFYNIKNLDNHLITLNNLLFIIIISFISQIGDFCISYFKRVSKIKDTGNLIPGHGGILDRIDGMIFAFPSTYLILKIIYP